MKPEERNHLNVFSFLRYVVVVDTLAMENGVKETSKAYFIIMFPHDDDFSSEINDCLLYHIRVFIYFTLPSVNHCNSIDPVFNSFLTKATINQQYFNRSIITTSQNNFV
ncbi:hypothetical protein OUZ56_000892 [Daphnia magna]|uniref:Uncharacterized protein n=1 Tax=Daphnia magna TaxID=35525 RepID=A0ABR0A130_9CRUS|nr:hypothetical protein OUZ56_000892 [Daphnia magna]